VILNFGSLALGLLALIVRGLDIECLLGAGPTRWTRRLAPPKSIAATVFRTDDNSWVVNTTSQWPAVDQEDVPGQRGSRSQVSGAGTSQGQGRSQPPKCVGL